MKKLKTEIFSNVKVGEWFYFYQDKRYAPDLYMKCSYGALEEYLDNEVKESDIYSNCVTYDGEFDYIFPSSTVWVEEK